jgi:hypothetical protein
MTSCKLLVTNFLEGGHTYFIFSVKDNTHDNVIYILRLYSVRTYNDQKHLIYVFFYKIKRVPYIRIRRLISKPKIYLKQKIM